MHDSGSVDTSVAVDVALPADVELADVDSVDVGADGELHALAPKVATASTAQKADFMRRNLPVQTQEVHHS